MKEANRFPDSVRTIARVDLKDTDDVLLTGEFFSQFPVFAPVFNSHISNRVGEMFLKQKKQKRELSRKALLSAKALLFLTD